MKKAVQLLAIPYTPEPFDTGVYFISNSGHLFRYTNQWDDRDIAFKGEPNTVKFYIAELKNKELILALPDEIGKVYRPFFGGVSSIEVADLQAILDNKGMCFLEMEPITTRCSCPCHGSGAKIMHIMACCNNGLITVGQKIKKNDDKVIIHLSQ